MSGMLTDDVREVLRAVGDEQVYLSATGAAWWGDRSGAGTQRWVRGAVNELLGRGLITEPPARCSFFELTDDGAQLLAQGRCAVSADLLQRAAVELSRAASYGRPVTIDAAIAAAIAVWLEDSAPSTPNHADDWPAVVVARAILREPS